MTTCIVCGSTAENIRSWSRSDITNAYERMAGRILPREANPIDYTIWRCTNCTLVFANPPVPGNADFYSWVTKVPKYYHEFRWEWEKAADFIRGIDAKHVLEIGCGTGNFLKYITETKGVKSTGLDTHEPSVLSCRDKNLDCYCQNIEQFLNMNQKTKFDIVCAYHCLEHVENPIDMLSSMKRLLNHSGYIIFSVPYSPTTMECVGWDCLNLPPHHVTRWNERSLAELIKRSNMMGQIQTESSYEPPHSALRLLYWNIDALRRHQQSAAKGWMACARHGITILRFLSKRDRVDGRIAGDIALVIASNVAS